LTIDYLWKSLRSVIFMIGLNKIDPSQADLLIFNIDEIVKSHLQFI